MSESFTFQTPDVPTNPSSWGPPSSDNKKFNSLPYAPFGRSDRLGRSADFTSSQYGYNNNRRDRRFGESNANSEFQYKVQEDNFELVDTTKTNARSNNFGMKKKSNQNRLKQLNARRDARGGDRNAYNNSRLGGRGRGGRGAGRGGRGRGKQTNWRARVDRQPSVAVQPDWTMVVDMDLNKVSKGITNTDTPTSEEDLLWCGFLDRYNEVYEKCSTRTPAVLKRCDNKEFYPVTTTDDPVIEKVRINCLYDKNYMCAKHSVKGIFTKRQPTRLHRSSLSTDRVLSLPQTPFWHTS